MTLQEYSQSLNEFYEKGHDKNIRDLSSMLSIVRKYVLDCFDKIDVREFVAIKGYVVTGANKKSSIRADLVSLIRKLNRNIKSCSNPKFDFSALKRVNSLFFDEKGNIQNNRMLAVIAENHCFYRMRSAEGYKIYSKEGIFQIAGENRKLSSKLRFSDDGHPCLYLGESLYIAWEEVRRPAFDTVNFALFHNTKKLKVLDLTVRPRFKYLIDFFMSYLSLLTSAKVEDDDRYKYRYEVSGILMKLLQNSVALNGNVDGIMYVSSRQFDGKEMDIKGRSQMTAYVFPPKEASDKGVDKWLKDTFKVSPVRTLFLYNIHLVKFVNPKLALTTDYQNTLFFLLEQQLQKEKLEKIK